MKFKFLTLTILSEIVFAQFLQQPGSNNTEGETTEQVVCLVEADN